MGEPSRMNVKVDIGQPNRPGPRRLVTLDRLVGWIKLQGLDDYTEKGLIELAAKYPTAALPSFRRNYNLMIQRVRAKRRKEQNGEANAEEVKHAEPVAEGAGNLEDALRQAFKPKEEGPEFTVARRPLFDESEPEAEAGPTEEGADPAPGFDDFEPVQFQGFEPEEWEEGDDPEVVTDGPGSDTAGDIGVADDPSAE